MDTYDIKILKWLDHNPKHKKGYTYFRFSNSFFSDPKIAQLRPIEVNLFIYLLCVMSESSSNQCQIHVKSVPKQFRISVKSLQNCLSRLQSLQLLTADKIPLIKEKLSKDTASAGKKPDAHPPTPSAPTKRSEETRRPAKTTQTWESYRAAYLVRYKIEPLRDAQVNSQLSRFIDRVGASDAPKIIAFYVASDNPYYFQRKHTVDAALRDAHTLRTSWLTGDKTNARTPDHDVHRRIAENFGGNGAL